MATAKGKIKKKTQKEVYVEFETANSMLINEQLHIVNKQMRVEVTHLKQHEKLQRLIHEKPAWRDYTR